MKTTYADGSSWRGSYGNNVIYWDHAGRRTSGRACGTTTSAAERFTRRRGLLASG